MNKSNGWNGIIKAYPTTERMINEWPLGHYVTGAPSTVELERLLTEKYRIASLATNMGRNAILATVMSLTNVLDTIAVSQDIYPGTKAFFLEMLRRNLLDVRWFDPAVMDMKDVLGAGGVGRGAKFVFVETIGNSPAMTGIDPNEFSQQIGEIDQGCYFMLDSTFTPEFKPRSNLYKNTILLGSITKYEADSDHVTGGRISARKDIIELIKSSFVYSNCAMLPSVAGRYLQYDSGESVFAGTGKRWRAHSNNAEALIVVCSAHQAVAEVYYPTLSSTEQLRILNDCYGGAGGVFYLTMAGGEEAARKLADALVDFEDWEIAASFGSQAWRVFPFIGPLAKHSSVPGLVRIAVGRGHRDENISACLQTLDSLL